MFVRFLKDSINFSYFILVGYTYGVNFFLKIRFILGLPSARRDLRYVYMLQKIWPHFLPKSLQLRFFTKNDVFKFLELVTNQEEIEYRESSKDSATIFSKFSLFGETIF